MPLDYLRNGVKRRLDGKGDGWANVHREALGQTFNMQDVDALFGAMAFGHNTGERLFLEYVPDNFENRGKRIRTFGTVAMFDRKSSLDFALSEKNSVSVAYYLDLCRRLTTQSLTPRFFFVIGGQQPPWRMVEIDVLTGEITGKETVISGVESVEWRRLWDALGLTSLRREIRRLVDPPRQPGATVARAPF